MDVRNFSKRIKNIVFINVFASLAFVFVLVQSNFSILSISTLGGDYFGPKIYGVEFNGINIPWYLLLAAMIVLLLTFFITLFDSIRIQLKNKVLLKSITVIITISTCILVCTVAIALCEREEYASVVLKPYSIFDVSLFPQYESIVVDTSNKEFIVLIENGNELKIKSTEEAQQVVSDLNSTNIVSAICIGYRKNLILSRDYKISSMWNYVVESNVFYKSGLQSDKDFKWY